LPNELQVISALAVLTLRGGATILGFSRLRVNCRHLWTFHFTAARDSNAVWKQFFIVVQVESSLFLIKHYAIEAYGDVKLWFYALLNLAPDGFMPKWFFPPPKERDPTIH
jgi:hypothetical protein